MINFTDRDSYLKWVATWREEYRDLSAQIRAFKRCRKQYLRAYPEGADRRTSKKRTIGPNPHWDLSVSWRLDGLRNRARTMMQERIESREIARQQREKRLKIA